MWLEGWHIEGFGHFSGQKEHGLPKGLVIVSGPNEAGKSTLLQFVQFMLFGRQRGGRGRGELADALAGGRVGGRLFFRDATSEVLIERLDGQVRLLEAGTRSDDPGAVARWLGGMDLAMFRAVFAVRHEDLAGLDGLGGDAVRQQLLAGGISGAGRDVGEARSQLDTARAKLWRPRASCSIRSELESIRELERKRLEFQTTASDALRGTAARAEIGRALKDLRRSIADNDQEQQRFRGLLQALEPDRELRPLEAELVALGPDRSIPSSLSEELELLDRAERDVDVKLGTIRDRITELEDEVKASETDSLFLEHEREIVALAERCQTLRAGDLSDLDASIASAASRVAGVLNEYGLGDRGQIERVPVHGVAVARLREAAGGTAGAAGQLAKRVEALERLQQARLALSQAETERDQIVVDRVALNVAAEVELLQRDAASDQSARKRLRSLTELRAARMQRRAELSQQLGYEPRDLAAIHCDAETRARIEAFSGAVRELRARCTRLDGERALAATRMESARVAHATSVTADNSVAESVFDELEAGADSACTAWTEAEARQREADERRGELSSMRALLGDCGVQQLERAVGVLASRSELETAGRSLEELERTIANRREQRDALVMPALVEGPSSRDVDVRHQALAQAEALVHAANERNARQSTRGQVTPSWIWVALLVLGVATAGMGATAAVRAGALSAVPWVALFIVLVALSLLARRAISRLGTGPASEEDPAERVTAFGAAGLPSDAGLGQIAAARVELGAAREDAAWRTSIDRQRQQIGGERDRIDQELGRLEVQRSSAETAWLSACQAHGVDGLRPQSLSLALARVEAARSIDASMVRAISSHRAALASWTSWTEKANPIAGALGLALATDAASARRLLAGIRKRRDHQRAMATEHERKARDLAAADDSLLRIEAELRTASTAAEEMSAKLSAARNAEGIPEEVSGHETRWLTSLDEARALDGQISSVSAELRDAEDRVTDREQRILAITDALGIPRENTDPLITAATKCADAERCEQQWSGRDQEVLTRTRLVHDAAQTAEQADIDARRAQVAVEAWTAMASECFLPIAIEPADLEHFLQALGRVRTDLGEIDQLHAQRALAADQRARAEQQAETLAKVLGVPYETAAATSRGLEAALEAARTRENARQRSLSAFAEAVQVRADLESRAAETMRSRALLLDNIGATSVAEARILITQGAQRAATTTRVADLRQARRLALGGVDDPSLLAVLQTAEPATWKSEIDRLDAEHEALQLRRDDLLQQQQVIASDLQRAGASADIAEIESALGAARSRLARHRRDLAALVIADELLRVSLEAFRAEHQPAVLRRASGLMSQVSAGTYTGLEIDDDDEFLLVDSAGGRRPVGQLSSGTRDLLYIVLRLSLAEDLARHYPAIPIVLDDLLVNLDGQRADELARVIAVFSTTHQVLVMTCRPETVSLLQKHAGEARIIDLPRYAGRETPVAGMLSATSSGRDDQLLPAAQRIHDVLEGLTTMDALRKEELLQRAGVEDAEWSGALKQLRQLGILDVRGKGRGSEYLLRRDQETAPA